MMYRNKSDGYYFDAVLPDGDIQVMGPYTSHDAAIAAAEMDAREARYGDAPPSDAATATGIYDHD